MYACDTQYHTYVFHCVSIVSVLVSHFEEGSQLHERAGPEAGIANNKTGGKPDTRSALKHTVDKCTYSNDSENVN